MPDYGFTHSTKDVDWIAKLGSEPSAQWIVITGDQRIRKNLAERAAWIKAGLKAFVLAPSIRGRRSIRVPRYCSGAGRK